MPNNSQALVDPEVAMKGITTEERFVNALFQFNFNKSAAARAVFDIDEVKDKASNGGNASAIGCEYLRKPRVQEILRKRMETQEISKEWVFAQYKRHVEGGRDFVSVKALESMARVMDIEIDPKQSGVARGAPVAVQINLSAPASDAPLIETKQVIDVPARSVET